MATTLNPGTAYAPFGQLLPGKIARLGRPFLACSLTLAIIALAATTLRSEDQLKSSSAIFRRDRPLATFRSEPRDPHRGLRGCRLSCGWDEPDPASGL